MDLYEIALIFNAAGIAFFLVNSWVGYVILVAGYDQLICYIALSLIFERNRKKAEREAMRDVETFPPFPKVSVIISAYNEEKVIESCVRSVLASDYPKDRLEVVVADDGSKDKTPKVLDRLREETGITVIHKQNGGKASGLNECLKVATGEVIVTLDADTSLSSQAISQLVSHMSNPRVGAVCGYDIPSNANNWLVKLLMLSSHVSTGMVRRALSVINCIMVVNFGAFRRSVLDKAGDFASMIGEDFEMTLRVHKLGYKIEFEPRAIAKSESPSSLKVLWNQRIRWFRGFLHGISMHKDMLRKGWYGAFLLYNLFANVIFPVFLFAGFLIFMGALVAIPGFASSLSLNTLYLSIMFFGLIPSFIVVVFSLWLDRNLRKYASYLWVFPLWAFYSLFLDMVCMTAVLLEVTRRERKWNAWVKTGEQTKA